MQDLVTSQVTLSAVMVVLMQWLKASPLAPWINAQSDTVNRLIAAFLAGITAIGIHYTYDAGMVTVTFTVAGVLHGLWHWIQSYAFQHIIYHGAFKPAVIVNK